MKQNVMNRTVMKRMLALALGLATVGAAPLGALAAEQIKVETRNLYLGADLNPVLGAGSIPEFLEAGREALEQIAANNFPERAEALASKIADKQPHLVGLQEAFDFQLNGQNGPPPFRNMLTDLMNALAAQGANYVVVASALEVDVSLPADLDGDGQIDGLVTVQDRDVILARADIAGSVNPVPFNLFCARPAPSGVSGVPASGCNYQVVLQAPLPDGSTITVERGWVGVDAVIDGKAHRFVDTHLETMSPLAIIQALQAAELLQTLAALDNPITNPLGANNLPVGDINSSPEDGIIPNPTPGFIVPGVPAPPPFDAIIIPPYEQFLQFGYTDSWDLRAGNDDGFTCCELSDLSNPTTLDDERIDIIFSLEEPSKVKSNVVGNESSDKTMPSRLWPSDHAGVVGNLTFP